MKKAIIIFGIALSLIVVGGIKTASEFALWNINSETFEDQGYQTVSIVNEIDISDLGSNSISVNNLFSKYGQELDMKFLVDKNQAAGKLSYSISYYPNFGQCMIVVNEYILDKDSDKILIDRESFTGFEKVFVDLQVYCDINNNIIRDFINYRQSYEIFKTMMKIKRLPSNIKQIVVKVNPQDQSKIIK